MGSQPQLCVYVCVWLGIWYSAGTDGGNRSIWEATTDSLSLSLAGLHGNRTPGNRTGGGMLTRLISLLTSFSSFSADLLSVLWVLVFAEITTNTVCKYTQSTARCKHSNNEQTARAPNSLQVSFTTHLCCLLAQIPCLLWLFMVFKHEPPRLADTEASQHLEQKHSSINVQD